MYTNALLATLNARKYLQLKRGNFLLSLGPLHSTSRSRNGVPIHNEVSDVEVSIIRNTYGYVAKLEVTEHCITGTSANRHYS